jgi:hypothetical protein
MPRRRRWGHIAREGQRSRCVLVALPFVAEAPRPAHPCRRLFRIHVALYRAASLPSSGLPGSRQHNVECIWATSEYHCS